MSNPRHLARVEEAKEYGTVAGREYQALADQVCPPEDWTIETRTRWCALLREIRTNPYVAGQYPHRDASDEQNAHYARVWEQAFVIARHAVQSESRRGVAA